LSWAVALRQGQITTNRSIPVVAAAPSLPPLLANGQAYTDLDRGMFLHWNFATFCDTEFVDPTVWPINTFSPTGLDIPQWAEVAANFGCRYAVLTIKHLDGFCLWPTTTTTWGVANTTWYAANGHPDIVQQYVDAFRAAGIYPFYYFSVGDKMWTAAHSPPGVTDPTVKALFKSYTEAQMTEVLTRYGQIGSIWLDSTYVWHGDATPWVDAAERNAFIRSVSPGIIIIDNSLRHTLLESDVVEYESTGPPIGNTEPAEACFSIGGPTRWFWKSDTQPNFDAGAIGGTMQSHNANNCATLPNVSPNPAGVIPAQFVERLDETLVFLGEDRVSPSNMTNNTTPSPYVASALTEYPGYLAWNCFNSTVDSFWSSNGGLPTWIQIDLGSAQTVSKYMMQARKGVTYGQWLAWTLAGSPDGSSWTTVDTKTQSVVVPGEVRFFTITPVSYRYWRWTITSTNTGTDADCAQLALV
jgi:alpha-L-fucosidase